MQIINLIKVGKPGNEVASFPSLPTFSDYLGTRLGTGLAMILSFCVSLQHRSSSRRLDFSNDSSGLQNSVTESSEEDEVLEVCLTCVSLTCLVLPCMDTIMPNDTSCRIPFTVFYLK